MPFFDKVAGQIDIPSAFMMVEHSDSQDHSAGGESPIVINPSCFHIFPYMQTEFNIKRRN